MADTNSVFRPQERYKGWQQGKNGYRALTSPTMHPLNGPDPFVGPRDHTAGTEGRDGPGSLAWELRRIGAVSVMFSRHHRNWSSGPHRLRTWCQRGARGTSNHTASQRPITTWALLDHIVVPSGAPFKALLACGIDNEDTFIWGSDHRGLMATFSCEALFGVTKEHLYACPPVAVANPQVPRFTEQERARVIARLVRDDDWHTLLVEAEDLAAAADLTDVTAQHAISQLWGTIHGTFIRAWTDILKEHLDRATVKPGINPVNHAQQKLATLRRARRRLFSAPAGSLRDLSMRDMPDASLHHAYCSAVAAAHKASIAAKSFGIKLPLPPLTHSSARSFRFPANSRIIGHNSSIIIQGYAPDASNSLTDLSDR